MPNALPRSDETAVLPTGRSVDLSNLRAEAQPPASTPSDATSLLVTVALGRWQQSLQVAQCPLLSRDAAIHGCIAVPLKLVLGSR
jgi:hypothetical protein